MNKDERRDKKHAAYGAGYLRIAPGFACEYCELPEPDPRWPHLCDDCKERASLLEDAHPCNAYIVGGPVCCPECNNEEAVLIRESEIDGGILTLACDECCWGGPHDDIIDPKLTIEKTKNLDAEGDL